MDFFKDKVSNCVVVGCVDRHRKQDRRLDRRGDRRRRSCGVRPVRAESAMKKLARKVSRYVAVFVIVENILGYAILGWFVWQGIGR